MTEIFSPSAFTDSRSVELELAPRPSLSALQLIHSNEGGGVEALAEMIASGLREHGVSVETRFMYPSIVATSGEKLRGIARVVAEIVRKRPDVLIAYQSTASVMVGVIGRLIGCKMRIVHQTAVPAEIHPAVRMFDKFAGAAGLYSVNIANSVATASAFAGYSARYRRHMRQIDHGLDAPRADRSRAEVLKSHAIPDDGLLLFNVGRLCDQKAQDRILRALPLIANARLVLAGGGPHEAQLRELASSLGVSDRVHFLGVVPRDAIGDLLGAADVFVFTSRWETFGLAVVEAAMAGVAIACNDLLILREVLSTSGQIPVSFADAANPQALAEAIERQRPTNLERRKLLEFSKAMKAKYSKARMLDAYHSLITTQPSYLPVSKRRRETRPAQTRAAT